MVSSIIFLLSALKIKFKEVNKHELTPHITKLIVKLIFVLYDDNIKYFGEQIN